jgi:hypothetical protein
MSHIFPLHWAYFYTILLFDFGGKELYFWRYVGKYSYLNAWILSFIYVNERDSLFLIHYKSSNSISSRCIFRCVFVLAIIWSNQIERSGSYYVFQKRSELWTRCITVPNLLAMCELAIFYILYKRSVISLAGQSLTLAIIKLYTDSVKRLSQQGIVYQILQICRLYVN